MLLLPGQTHSSNLTLDFGKDSERKQKQEKATVTCFYMWSLLHVETSFLTDKQADVELVFLH